MSFLSWLEDLWYMKVRHLRKVTVADVLSSSPAGLGVPKQRISVSYQLAGSSSWTSDGSSTTNAQGRTTSVVYLKKGRYNFIAMFLANGGYEASSAVLNDFQV